MNNATQPVPFDQLPNLPPCPRCCGEDHFDESGHLSLWLCDRCGAQLEEVAAEEAAEDRARDAFEDREAWGGR